jgi:hypothetical protein
MTQKKITVKCRKCENTFVISKDTVESVEKEAPPPASSIAKFPPPSHDFHTMTLVIRKVPNETARLRIATRLMPIARQQLSAILRRLSKIPAVFQFEMDSAAADSLLRALKSAGVEAEFLDRAGSGINERYGAKAFPGKRWKRWSIAAVIMLLLAIAGSLSYHLYREVEKTHRLETRGIDSVFPSGSFLYIRFQDIEKNWRKIEESSIHGGLESLFERLESIPYVEKLLSRKRAFENSMGVPFLRPDLKDFIGSDVRVAFYPGDSSRVPQLVLTVRANLKIKVLETLGRWMPPWGDRSFGQLIGQEPTVDIFRLGESSRAIHFYSEGMVYIASTSPDLIRKSLSLLRKNPPQENSPAPVSLSFKKHEMAGLNQIASFYVGLQDLIGVWSGKDESRESSPLIEHLTGWQDISGTLSYGKGLVVESAMTVDRDSLAEPIRALFECPPVPHKTLALLPRTTMIYASNQGFDLASYISWLRKNLNEHRNSSIFLDRILQEVREKTGVDVEKEVLPFLGRGVSYAIIDGKKAGGARFPAIQLFVEVKDRPKVEASIRRLLKTPVLRSWLKKATVDLTSTQYQGVPITSLRWHEGKKDSFFISAPRPSWSFVDDFLVISTSLESLKEMVDLSQGRGVSMVKDRRFRETRRLFRDRSNGMAYVDLKAISRVVGDPTPTRSLIPGITRSDNERVQSLRTFCEILETLNYVWSETEFEGDRVRVLIHVGL